MERAQLFDLDRLHTAALVAAIDFHESLGSTSDRALELAARDDAALPLLVLAQRQTAGRGRGANRWWAAEGALTFSLVLHAPADRLPHHRWSQVALIAGLAVCEALETLAPAAELRLKWPNDVFLADGKVGGILSESVPGWRDRLVVGIGINVNNAVRQAGPAELQRPAAALVDHDGLRRDLTTTLLEVLDQFDRRWHELTESGFAPLAPLYRQKCLLTGRTVTVEQHAGQRIVGLARGIDDEGALVLATERGPQRVLSGTVIAWNGG